MRSDGFPKRESEAATKSARLRYTGRASLLLSTIMADFGKFPASEPGTESGNREAMRGEARCQPEGGWKRFHVSWSGRRHGKGDGDWRHVFAGGGSESPIPVVRGASGTETAGWGLYV